MSDHEPQEMKLYEIWAEGFAATCEKAGEEFVGFQRAKSFEDACKIRFAEDRLFDADKMTHWGRRLVDSRHEATKSTYKNGRPDHEPQNPPKSGNVEVTPEVIADLRARSEMGKAKYGTVLRSMNGRSALTDLYQELLDGACYVKQRLIEESQDIPELIEENKRLKKKVDELQGVLKDVWTAHANDLDQFLCIRVLNGFGYQVSIEGNDQSNDDRLVTVCAECKQASCWQGQFYCDSYKTASTIELPISELRKMGLESPEHWEDR